METANILNTFFSNVVQNLDISRFPDSDPLIQNIKDPTLKAILKYRKYPGIVAIERRYRDISSFIFVEVNEVDIEKVEIRLLETLICQLKLSEKFQIFLLVFYAPGLVVQ